MKYCQKCGKEIMDEAVICPGCGCMVENNKTNTTPSVSGASDKKVQISTILGSVGIAVAWFFALAGHVVSIVGIVMGIKDYKETRKSTGLVFSIVGEVCSVISSIIGIVTFSGLY